MTRLVCGHAEAAAEASPGWARATTDGDRFRVLDIEAYLAANRDSAEAHPAQDTVGGLVRGLAHRVSRPRPGQVTPGGRFRGYSEEALRYSHGVIGTEHLLVGLLGEDDKGIAAKVLRGLRVDLGKVRALAEYRLDHQTYQGAALPGPEGEGGITDQAKRTYEFAVKEADSLHHQHIGPEHLLLGLVRESETGGYGVIQALGLDPEVVRKAVLREISGQTSD